VSEWFTETPEQAAAADFSLPGDDQFVERLNESREPPAAVEAPVETAAPPDEPATRARDERGRFVAQEAEDAGEQPPDRYKTEEARNRAREEKLLLFDRQANELGEVRKQNEQLLQLLQMQQQAAPLDEYAVEENPAAAAQQALETGNARMYEQVMRQWHDLDPSAATMFGMIKQYEYQRWLDRQAFDQLAQPVQQQQYLGTLASAWSDLQRSYPDLDQHRDAIASEANRIQAMTGRNLVTEMINSGDPSQTREALETLYLRARARGSDTLVQAATEAAREAAQQSQRARDEAVVTSATATEQAVPVSSADRLAAQWDAKDRLFSAENGWNI